MTVDLFSDSKCTVAEGPRWNGAERTLYWVDITEGAVLRQRVDEAAHGFERFVPGLGKIGAVEFAPDGRLLLFTERCEVYVSDFGGVLAETVRFPMAKVTSACIGDGCVFVTTGNLPKSDAECAATKAGGVFVLRKE